MKKELLIIALSFLTIGSFLSPALATYTENDTYEAPSVKSITLSGSGSDIKWTLDGVSEQGFKVVWSKNENPVYPNREGDKYHYYSESTKRSDTIEAFNGNGTYYVRVCEYLGGKCGVYSNQITLALLSGVDAIACTMEYAPVCGKDAKTYSNKCMANANGVVVKYTGECGTNNEINEIEDKAELLAENKLDAILLELKELRNLVREQQTEIKYLRSLLDEMGDITEEMRHSINSFITYGVDDNTKKLGEGERAAVMHSYKEAFGKLPATEKEMSDLIMIANGRYPAEISDEAESVATKNFYKIYKRLPDLENAKDKAAITVMAYGLRQKAENRNLNSEKAGIGIYKNIFGRNPISTEDWNLVQAITYSGATR